MTKKSSSALTFSASQTYQIDQIILATLIGAFTFVMGLAINNLVESFIDKYVPEGQTLTFRSLYVLIVFIVGIIGIYALVHLHELYKRRFG